MEHSQHQTHHASPDPHPGNGGVAVEARVYTRAAASIYGIDRFAERQWRELEGLLPATAAQHEPVTAPSARTQRRVTVGSNWMKR